jgi:hypothetical protein
MQDYRTCPPHDKRGGCLATNRDKAPPKIHHAQVIRVDFDLLAEPPPDVHERLPRRPRSVREPRQAKRKPRDGTPLRRRRRSPPGRGPAEGQGRAVICLLPAPGSRFSTPACAPIRPPPGRCAPAWRCRAPRLAPKSCASTPTQPRCATCASPLATRSGPRRTFYRYGAISSAGRPASTPAGSATRRRGWTWLCRTRTAWQPT